MTIAIGLLCQDGILLCADTEHTVGSSKSHHAKLEHFDVAGGHVCFALAGASDLAWSAIQKCKKELQSPSADLIAKLEEILEREYRRHVLGHPNPDDWDYQLLVAVHLPNQRPKLFFTVATAFIEIHSFQCIGIGDELAQYLLRPGFPVASFHDALSLSAYTLSCVKNTITGCGGDSIYLFLRKDGETGLITSGLDGPTKDLDKVPRLLDFKMRQLMMWMANPLLSQGEFEKHLTDVFSNSMLQIRNEWSQQLENRLKLYQESNPELTPKQVKAFYLDISLGFNPKASYPK